MVHLLHACGCLGAWIAVNPQLFGVPGAIAVVLLVGAARFGRGDGWANTTMQLRLPRVAAGLGLCALT